VMFQRFAGDGDALSAPEFQILENSSHTMAGRSRSESPWLCDSPSLSEHQSRLDANPLYNVVVSRKRAEQDSILLANRIRLLRAEEEKTRKKTKETEKKTQEILELRRRSEERRVAKEAEDARREAEERELRSRQMQEREEQNRKLSERQRSILEQKTDMSSAVRSEREANMQAVEEQRLMEAADVMAKAEKVRATAQAAARSRARSEGAKHELAQGIVQERMVREDDIRRTKALEIERMESEEAQLISRLQQSQERHRAAYLRLENALQHNGGGSVPASHPGTPGARSAKGLSCGTSVSSRALAVGATGVAAAVSSLGSGGGSSSSSCSAGGGGRGYRPPRPGGPPSSLILHFVGSAAAMPQHHQQHQQQQQQQQQRRAPMARTVSAAGLGVRFEQQQQQQHQQQQQQQAPPRDRQLDPDLGSPGDFRFSDVPKPENYLHTYRDLHTRVHTDMLGQLWEGTHRFLRSLFDENFMAHATISAGFHYPVRTQYATLHMQVRVNAGNICGEDGRGMEVGQLIETLKRDRMAFERDAETVKYQVTENVKVSLLAAASEYEQQNPGESACRQVAPLSYELGATAMPTIHDEGEEEEEAEKEAKKEAEKEAEEAEEAEKEAEEEGEQKKCEGGIAKSKDEQDAQNAADDSRDSQIALNHEVADEVPASYLVNIQPAEGSVFYTMLYEQRQKCADEFGADPTFLYPLHVSVTGFFEASEFQIRRLRDVIPEMLQRELKDAGGPTIGKVICTKTGYVLFDMQASAITNFSQRLGEVSSRQCGLHIRPKAVNHISLACNRPEEAIREKIRRIFEAPEDAMDDASRLIRETRDGAEFDLVISRLLARSSFERLSEDGPHKFTEVVRIPLNSLIDIPTPR